MSVPQPIEADAELGGGGPNPSARVLQRGVRAVPGMRIPQSSVRAVAKVAKTDGRTIVQVYRIAGGEWCRPRRRTRFTYAEIERMRGVGVAEVVLRRALRRTSMPLSWIP